MSESPLILHVEEVRRALEHGAGVLLRPAGKAASHTRERLQRLAGSYWVRETHILFEGPWKKGQALNKETFLAVVRYDADESRREFTVPLQHWKPEMDKEPRAWAAAGRMPQWASRMVLEVKRVEPVQLHAALSGDLWRATGYPWTGHADSYASCDHGALTYWWDHHWRARAPVRSNPWALAYHYEVARLKR